jgi:hypothetical protein
LPNISDALMKVGQQTLSTLFAFLVEDDTLQMARPADTSNRH